MIILDQTNKSQCVNCQTVTTSDGKTVWVCENCGEVNQPEVTTSTEAPLTTAPEPTTVASPNVPETVDVSTAQAELDQAASQLGTTPPPPAPVETELSQQPTE